MPRDLSSLTSAPAGASVGPLARLALVKVIPGVADFGTSHGGLIGQTGSALAWPFRERLRRHGISPRSTPNLSRTLALAHPRASHLAASRCHTSSTTTIGGCVMASCNRGSLWGSPEPIGVRCRGFFDQNRSKNAYSCAFLPVSEPFGLDGARR